MRTDRRQLEDAGLFAASVLAGGAGFVGACAAGQALQRVLRVAAHAAPAASLAGALTVAAAAVTAGESAALVAAAGRGDLAWRRRVAADDAARLVGAGALLFLAAGGRFRSLAPSDLRFPGAFMRRRGSLPAGLDYASTGERASIHTLGRLLGCHSCGRRGPAVKYIADHMPPVAVVKRANARWWRRLLRLPPLEQRFFPQCRPCSQRQAVAVKKDAPDLVMHAHRLRRHHAAGALAVLLLGPAGDGGPVGGEEEGGVLAAAPKVVRFAGAGLPELRAAEAEARAELARLRGGGADCQCTRRCEADLREIERLKRRAKAGRDGR